MWPRRGAIGRPVTPSQSQAVWSDEAETIRRPSGPNATDRIVFLWPRISAIGRPVAASHRRTVLSGYTLPEARRDPSGLKARAPGYSTSPRSTATSRPVIAIP